MIASSQMTAVKTKFDGKQIEVPDALRSSSPREVLVIFDEPTAQGVKPSIWDAFGRAPRPLSGEELLNRLRSDRDEWDER